MSRMRTIQPQDVASLGRAMGDRIGADVSDSVGRIGQDLATSVGDSLSSSVGGLGDKLTGSINNLGAREFLREATTTTRDLGLNASRLVNKAPMLAALLFGAPAAVGGGTFLLHNYLRGKYRKNKEKEAAWPILAKLAEEDKLPGGLADDKPTSKYRKDEVAEGTEVELEHTDDKELSQEIAEDHLEEHPDYYDRLKKMEERAEAGLPQPGVMKNAGFMEHLKALGRKVSGFDQHIWDERKFDIVVAGNLLKFRQNMTCQRFLIRTADKILVEASPYDRIWGIGLSEEDARLMDPSEWPGQNLLGKALMLVRERIFKKSNLPHP